MLVVTVPDTVGAAEFVVVGGLVAPPFPQPGKKVVAVTAPNNIASAAFDGKQQDFDFIDQPPYIRPGVYRPDPYWALTSGNPYICGNALGFSRQHKTSCVC